MAETLTAVDGGSADNPPGMEHNAKSRKQIIAECAQAMRRIKTQRKDLNEEAGDIRQRLVDNGIDKKSFEAALRIADMDDDNARDTYIDGLRESMAALGLGDQGEFFPKETAA